tara:strand:- start:3191 stop:4777 length:1587 start_codon:yes stop_codon:yes gene_type:complete
MKILGFQSGHDVGYCILENGIPTIHEELERFIREKEPLGDGLNMAINHIPKSTFKEIKHFAHGNPGEHRSFLSEPHINGKIHTIGHHQSHAANAFFSSNYDESLIITIDGSGTEKDDYLDTEKRNGDFSSAFTVWEGEGNKIKPLIRLKTNQLTLGGPWRRYTGKIFGLSSGHPHGLAAGTVMALASVGNPDKYFKDFYNAFLKGGGGNGKGVLSNCKKYKAILDKDNTGKEKFDVAAAIQKATEVVTYETLKPIIEQYKPKNICFAGGVILNSVVMGKMFDWFGIKNLYVCPVPYDAGCAIGAAQYIYHQVLDHPRVDWKGYSSPYLGITYEKNTILSALKRDDITYDIVDDETVLNLLDKQNIISVFNGGAESGRRALGNRSILADPRSEKMKELINKKVKHRQWYRPFAPSILREDVKNWFEKDIDSPYMSFVLKFKKDKKDKVPAVVHLDGTGRLQTVTKQLNKWYYNFIKSWKEKTGVPILLNTSFNDREPIVETPEHAVKCFLGTEIDYLYFSDYKILVKKV